MSVVALTSYLAVDPGGQIGWAEFAPFGRLGRCGLARPKTLQKIPTGIPLLVIEKPHGGRGKASRLDVATLARRMQMVIDHVGAAKVVEVSPTRWKKTIDGDIMTRRIRTRWMDPAEVEILSAIRAYRNHNVLDSIGLGIWYAAILGLRELP